MVKKARVRAKTLPWIGKEVRKLMKARTYYCTKAKKSKKVEDWEQYRRLRNRVTWELKKAKLQYFDDLSHQASGNPKKLWKELNRVLGRGSEQNIEALKVSSGRVIDRQGIVEELSKYFSSWSGVSGAELDEDQFALPQLSWEFKFEKIEEEIVLNVLKWLDINKATGLDNISAKLGRMAAPAISQSLASLFNFSLESGQVASEWKMARVSPVPKGTNSETVDNFHPMSVLPVVAKVFERIVHHQLSAYLQKNSILSDVQLGFRPQHTTQDVLVGTIDDWRQALDEASWWVQSWWTSAKHLI